MVTALDQQPSWILIYWAFINQIIVEVLADWNAHDRIWSCHKDQIHQKSKLYIVPYIVPDIGTWYRNFILYCHHRPSISNNFIWYWKKTFDIWPNIQIYTSLPPNIGPDIEYCFWYHRKMYSISCLIFNFDHLFHQSAPDMEDFYSILGTLSNTI